MLLHYHFKPRRLPFILRRPDLPKGTYSVHTQTAPPLPPPPTTHDPGRKHLSDFYFDLLDLIWVLMSQKIFNLPSGTPRSQICQSINLPRTLIQRPGVTSVQGKTNETKKANFVMLTTNRFFFSLFRAEGCEREKKKRAFAVVVRQGNKKEGN